MPPWGLDRRSVEPYRHSYAPDPAPLWFVRKTTTLLVASRQHCHVLMAQGRLRWDDLLKCAGCPALSVTTRMGSSRHRRVVTGLSGCEGRTFT
ncbi:hypothetical protein ADK70_34410 [Streptomyces rimosus subsp. pseudoverticillatus]|nr:hypothetical protein ADK70_34410 [Streptomyces rimosus subsp. pseudoverticillatus]